MATTGIVCLLRNLKKYRYPFELIGYKQQNQKKKKHNITSMSWCASPGNPLSAMGALWLSSSSYKSPTHGPSPPVSKEQKKRRKETAEQLDKALLEFHKNMKSQTPSFCPLGPDPEWPDGDVDDIIQDIDIETQETDDEETPLIGPSSPVSKEQKKMRKKMAQQLDKALSECLMGPDPEWPDGAIVATKDADVDDIIQDIGIETQETDDEEAPLIGPSSKEQMRKKMAQQLDKALSECLMGPYPEWPDGAIVATKDADVDDIIQDIGIETQETDDEETPLIEKK
jgi:hypothetical protein